MRVLFAVHSNGLGHATRCIPLIREVLKEKHEVYIISSKRALEVLQKEFGSKIVKYFDVPDYSLFKLFTQEHFSVRRFIIKTPVLTKEFLREHSQFVKIQKKYKFEVIISDTRFGIYDDSVPSFIILHHIKLGIGGIANKLSEILTELFYYTIQTRFKYFLIPDFEKNGGVGGNICHKFMFFGKKRIRYLGILSMVRKKKVKQDIDYFFSVSGPGQQRDMFEKIVMSQIDKVKGRVVVTLGKPEAKKKVEKRGNITIYSYFNREQQEAIMNKSKMIITRSGYTTMMELAELGKKALLVPTKDQPEQEYLSDYHMKKKTYLSVSQDDLNLERDLMKAEKYKGFKAPYSTDESVKRFMKIVFNK